MKDEDSQWKSFQSLLVIIWHSDLLSSSIEQVFYYHHLLGSKRLEKLCKNGKKHFLRFIFFSCLFRRLISIQDKNKLRRIFKKKENLLYMINKWLEQLMFLLKLFALIQVMLADFNQSSMVHRIAWIDWRIRIFIPFSFHQHSSYHFHYYHGKVHFISFICLIHLTLLQLIMMSFQVTKQM